MSSRLPAIRVSEEVRQAIFNRLSLSGKSYSSYVLELIAKDGLFSDDEIPIDKSKKSMDFVRVNCLIPRNIAEYLTSVKREQGLSISEQIRKVLMENYGVRELEENEVMQLMQTNYQLMAIGRNLNQLTRQANANKAVQIPESLVELLLEKVDEARSDIAELVKSLGL